MSTEAPDAPTHVLAAALAGDCLAALAALARIPEQLRAVRERRGLGLTLAGSQMGLAAGTLSRLESCGRYPTPGHLAAIARWARNQYAPPIIAPPEEGPES